MANNNPAQTGLISPGSSSRLAAMRAQVQTVPSVQPHSSATGPHTHDGLALLQQAIDQRLDAILATLPAGKQQRLFQIRYGFSVEYVRQLPIQTILSTLAITCPQVLLNSRQMPALLTVNYYGQTASHTNR